MPFILLTVGMNMDRMNAEQMVRGAVGTIGRKNRYIYIERERYIDIYRYIEICGYTPHHAMPCMEDGVHEYLCNPVVRGREPLWWKWRKL